MKKLSIALLALLSMASIEAYAKSNILLPNGKDVKNIEESLTKGDFIGVKNALIGYAADQAKLGSVDHNSARIAIKVGDTYVPLDKKNWRNYEGRAANAQFALSLDDGNTWPEGVHIRNN